MPGERRCPLPTRPLTRSLPIARPSSPLPGSGQSDEDEPRGEQVRGELCRRRAGFSCISSRRRRGRSGACSRGVRRARGGGRGRSIDGGVGRGRGVHNVVDVFRKEGGKESVARTQVKRVVTAVPK